MTTYTLFRLSDRQAQKELATQRRYMQRHRAELADTRNPDTLRRYFLRPLRDGLPPLHGRGITYDAEQGTYMVTLRAYDKIKAQYKIKRETCLD